MKIGTILFTYCRSEHTNKVIEALKCNSIRPEKLYIFQDGKNASTNQHEWEKVGLLIDDIDWCEKEVHISEENRGLAKSVVLGVGLAFMECDAVIVLEDDCVPHSRFMEYMTEALEFYYNQKKVYSISGYAWNVDLSADMYDAYFTRRVCSWGWGTWKDRWKKYSEDYGMLREIKRDETTYQMLKVWGINLERFLLGNITGQCDSWAVFWALTVIRNGGFCLSPYTSLIHNIGFDGSGTHGTVCKEEINTQFDFTRRKFNFPKTIQIKKECEREFVEMQLTIDGEGKLKLYQSVLQNWIRLKQAGYIIRVDDLQDGEVAVWGKGNFFDLLVNEIGKKIAITYIIESVPSKNEYKGFSIISISELPDTVKSIIVIPFYDMKRIERKISKIRDDIVIIGLDNLINRNL